MKRSNNKHQHNTQKGSKQQRKERQTQEDTQCKKNKIKWDSSMSLGPLI
jgi:hypothetical protein